MVQLNKYLKEIGIDENYWLFDQKTKSIDDRYNPDEEGFVDAEFFSLDTSLSLYIYSQLCYFREYCSYCSVPMGMEEEKWHSILNKMIEAFKLMIIDDGKNIDFVDPRTREQYSKNKEKKIRYGLRLFIKYYRCLWY